jgi:hypothetical protein
MYINITGKATCTHTGLLLEEVLAVRLLTAQFS